MLKFCLFSGNLWPRNLINLKNMGYSNKEILQGIVDARSKVLEYLYAEYIPMIKTFILNNSGNINDAEDVFQDTMIIVFKKIQNGNLKLTSSFKTYFYAICKKLWLQRLPLLQRIVDKDQSEESWNDILGHEEYKSFEEEKLFQDHFRRLDLDCQKVLASFFERRPYSEIANELKFKSSYIKKLKFNCKEKLYQSIINDPIYLELMDINLDDHIKYLKKNNQLSKNKKSGRNSTNHLS